MEEFVMIGVAMGVAGILLGLVMSRKSAHRTAKEDFLQRVAGEGYGYEDSVYGHVDQWRLDQLPALIAPNRLDGQMVYLDYAGAGLPVKRQMEGLVKEHTILGNPHSVGPIASGTSKTIEQVKEIVLRHFCGERAHEYDLIFTAGATASLKLVAEFHPFTDSFVFTRNCHTSVAGMRNIVSNQKKDGTWICVDLKQMEQQAREGLPQVQHRQDLFVPSEFTSNQPIGSESEISSVGLVCCPLECNFSGYHADIGTIARSFHSGNMDKHYSKRGNNPEKTRWIVLADIAKAAATSPVDLASMDIDLACVSFYKLFGFPTGLGALIGKRDVLKILLRERRSSQSYFGGGTVDAWLPDETFNPCRMSLQEAFAEGTVHFQGIASLKYGFEELKALGGMKAIQKHVHLLQRECIRRMKLLQHGNGQPVIKLYNEDNVSSIVTFNVLRSDGKFVGYAEVNKLASLNQPPLQLRTGCFCNVGACQEALSLTNQQIKHNYSQGHRCGDDIDMIDDQPSGAIRASFGKDSLWEDMDALVSFLENTFKNCSVASTQVIPEIEEPIVLKESGLIQHIWVYPVKSCAGIKVTKDRGWPFDTEKGILCFDREWAIVDGSGAALRMSAYPFLARIVPQVDFHRRTLILSYKDDIMEMDDLVLPIDNECETMGGLVSVCGDQCPATSFGGQQASEWLTKISGMRCFLVRHSSSKQRPRQDAEDVYFANESPILAVSQDSIDALNTVLARRGDKQVDARYFRPNFLIKGGPGTKNKTLSLASGENLWKTLTFDAFREQRRISLTLTITGQCARCSMVDIDPTSGAKNGSTLRALASHTRHKARILFGVFCNLSKKNNNFPKHVWVFPNNQVFISAEKQIKK